MTKQVKLIKVGEMEGVAASDLKLGQTVTWNYGMKSKVIGIAEVSNCYVMITFQSLSGGQVNKKKFRKNHVFAIEDVSNTYVVYEKTA